MHVRIPFQAIALIVAAGLFAAAVTTRFPASIAAASPAVEKLTEEQALALQKKFEDSQVAGNVQATAALMADNAVFVHATSVVQSKAEFIAALSSGKLKVARFETKNRRVILFDGGALVEGAMDIGMLSAPTGSGGQDGPRTNHVYLSTLWAHTPAGWQVLLSHGTFIPQPAGR